MAEAAPKRWTIAEFLAWDDGTDRRYELIDGAPVARAPPSEAHGTIVINLGSALGALLQPPCRVVGEAGIVLPERDDAWYQADLAITCTPPDPGRAHVEDPLLIAEVLSPSTAVHDRGRKLVDYCRLASVREILLVAMVRPRGRNSRQHGCAACVLICFRITSLLKKPLLLSIDPRRVESTTDAPNRAP